MTVRAGVVVTGTEVLTGRVTDRNGPWLAEQLRLLGCDIAMVTVVGDRPEDMTAALRFLAGIGVDLVVTSGGLGPTADDATADVVAAFQNRPMDVDESLFTHIADIVARLNARRGWTIDPAASEAGSRKQARVPEGASVLDPVGTAPGLVVTGDGGPPVVVLPGPPGELRPMWPAAVADPTIASVLSAADELRQSTIRLWGPPESELAAVLREHPDEQHGLEVTTCLRDGELEIVTRYRPEAAGNYEALHAVIAGAFGDSVFSPDGATIDDIVATLLTDRGITVATAESCTGGLLAARLTERPGSSGYVMAGVTAYSNDAKQRLLDVPAGLIEAHGSVSAEVAAAMATGVRRRLGTSLGIGVTGVAGPGGGTETKPVGLVEVCIAAEDGVLARQLRLGGGRGGIRRRTVDEAMHLIRLFVADGARST